MLVLPDFTRTAATDEPLVIHRHGADTGSALIVLIHGLGGDRYGTWTAKSHRAEEASLPKFLYEDIQELDVALFSYTSLLGRVRWWKSLELTRDAALLAERLREFAKTYSTLILAGHSMGGILARASVAELIAQNDQQTLEAIKGLFLLASPSAGSMAVPRWLSWLNADTRALSPHGKLVTDIQQIFTDRIVSDAAHIKPGQFFIPAFVVIAAEDLWVDRFSSGLNVPRDRRWTVRTGHTGAVKPRSRDDDGYFWMRDRVNELVARAPSKDKDDAFDACDLHGKLFINRVPLRDALRDMTSDDGSTRVVAVTGPPRSGKSHSIYLIEHAQHRNRYDKAVVEIARNQSPSAMTPVLVAESVLYQIGVRMNVKAEPKSITRNRWIARTADQIVGQVKAKPHPVFVVLDGFGHKNLPEPTKELVRELVKRADREPRLRIALLDYSEELLPPEVSGRLATEPIAQFTEQDLRDFFVSYAKKQGWPLPAASTITTIVDNIFAALSAEDRTKNERIAALVQAWARQLKPIALAGWSADAIGALSRNLVIPAANVATPQQEQMHDAAALVSSFAVNEAERHNAEVEHLLADCVEVRVDGLQRWSLTHEARKRALARLRTIAAMRAQLDRTHDRPRDTLQLTLEGWLRGDATPVERQKTDELVATLQVIDWFAETELAPRLPSEVEVRRRVALAELLDPMRALAGPQFRGRDTEIAVLRAYVDDDRGARGGRRHALIISGPGGMGKTTLLAHFVLENSNRVPYVYLDCDRPGLSAEEPLTLLAEAVRQLGLQFPTYAASAERLRAAWLREVADAYTRGVGTRGRDRALREFHAFVRDDLQLGERAVLFAIDTFEEVQFRSANAAREVFELLAEMQLALPGLRAVVAGRNQVAGFTAESLEIAELDDDSAAALLEALEVSSLNVRNALVRALRGNPLSLRLAADVVKRKPDTEVTDLERISDHTEIQGVLYNRVLMHIHEEDVRSLAHPGLILRRITPEIIRDVLAKPCGLKNVDTPRAHALFALLSNELSLVTSDGDGVRHRADVRRVMLPAVKKDRAQIVRSVQEAAITHYDKSTDPVDRAEEIYHRLALGQPPATIEERWLPGVEPYLASAIDEFDGASRAFLAARLGVEVYDLNWDTVDQATWEKYVARQAEELLRLDRPLDALRLVRRRSIRLADSPIYWFHAQALARGGQRLESREVARQAITAALRDGELADSMTGHDRNVVDRLLDWFTSAALNAPPSGDAVRAQGEWLDRLQPLYDVADRLFVGRAKELDALAAFASSPERANRLLVVSGVGGVGKSSLVARFALDRLTSMSLAYIDIRSFWPGSGDIGITRLLRDVERQLELQHHSTTRDTGRPVLIVVDNVGSNHETSDVDELDRTVRLIDKKFENARTIFISRSDQFPFPHESLHLGGLDMEAQQAYLEAEGVDAPELRARIAEQSNGSPLILRLAADLFKREGRVSLETSLSFSGSDITNTLIMRILGHLRDPRVRQMALTAMLIPRITPDILREVIAPATNVVIPDEATLSALFHSLAAEVSLFVKTEEGLRPRGDVRRLMMRSIRLKDPSAANSIHEAAVRYHAARDERRDEVYHRLMMGQSAADIDSRWIDGIERSLVGSIDDFPPSGRTYLAARLHLDLPEVDWTLADQPSWERHVAVQSRLLIANGNYQEAIELLRQRSTRLPRSTLYALEANALLRNDNPREALLVARRGLDAWPDDPLLPSIVADCERVLGADAVRRPEAMSAGEASLQIKSDAAIEVLLDIVETAIAGSTDVLMLARRLGLEKDLPVGATTPRQLAVALWQSAQRERRLDELITEVANFAPKSERLQAALGQTTVLARSRGGDPVASVRISGGTFVFGRPVLREFLRGVLSAAPQQQVLVVSGPRRSGKSVTARLVDHVSRLTSSFQFMVLRVEDPGLSLSDAVRSVYEFMGWRWSEVRGNPHDPEPGEIRRLAAELVTRASRERRRIVLMIELSEDGNPQIREFSEWLIRNPHPLVLIVTGLDARSTPRSARTFVTFEVIGDISKEEAEDGARQIARDFSLPIDAIESMARKVFDATERGPGFNQRFVEEFRRFLGDALEEANRIESGS